MFQKLLFCRVFVVNPYNLHLQIPYITHSTYYINDVLILLKNTSERIWTKSVPSPSITGVHYYIYLDIECTFILHVIAVHHGIECLFAFISALLVRSL